jgi:3-methylcrotonyl-CoA carboxylase alpha subunit
MPPATIILRHGARDYEVTIGPDGLVRVDGQEILLRPGSDGAARVGGGGGSTAWSVAKGDTRWVFLDGRAYEFELQRPGRRRRLASHHGTLTAPMPATVRRINVSPGDRVERGATLIVLEAMKMELPVRAGSAAIVESINCREGDLVQPGTALIELDEVEEG